MEVQDKDKQIQITSMLHAHGISTPPGLLQEMLKEAIELLPARISYIDPRNELSGEEIKELEAAGFNLIPENLGKENPLSKTVTRYAAMLMTAYTVKQTARLLKVNESRIRQRLTHDRTLYGMKIQSEWRIPKFQFIGNILIPGLEKVLPQLDPSLNPVALLTWFTTPNQDLEKEETTLSPLDWLVQGYDPLIVAQLAEDL